MASDEYLNFFKSDHIISRFNHRLILT